MNDRQKRLFELPFNKDILLICREKNSIQDISRKVGLSYKTTFNRIKEMESEKLVKLTQEGNKMIVTISEPEAILNLTMYASAKKNLDNDLKGNLSEIILLLEFYKNKRLSTFDDLYEHIKNQDINLLIKLDGLLDKLGYVRTRKEITKKGIKFLHEHKK